MVTRPQFVSAHPDTPWFVWQTHVYVQNFLDQGIEPAEITALFGLEPGAKATPELEALRRHFPEVDIRLLEDRRDERGRHYPPSIQPHLIEQWLRAVPERAGPPTFFHDCDIALQRLPDFDAMIDEHPGACLLSDTISYIGYDHLHEVCEKIRSGRPDVPEDDLIRRMCSVVGIALDTVKDNQSSSGGAQYFYSDIGPDYWAKVYRDSLDLRELLDDYRSELGLEAGADDFVLEWTAGMWAYLWNLWAAGREVVVHPEMAFLFSVDDLRDDSPIIHMAGKVDDDVPRFDKHDWRHLNPIETLERQPYLFDHHPSHSVAGAYADLIRTAAGVASTGLADVAPARHWRVLTWHAGPHRQVWDVERLHLRFDSGAEIADRIASGSAGRGFEAEHAFQDDERFWGGRAETRPGCRPELYLGVALDRPATPTAITLTHAASEHRTSVAMVQSSDDGDRWRTCVVASTPTDRRTHTLLHRPARVDTARAWRLLTRRTAHEFAWDVLRIRFLHHDEEQGPTLSSSGDAGPAFEVDNAAHDHGVWGGRPDEHGHFHITAADDDGLSVDRIVLDQGQDHWAHDVVLQRSDDGVQWQTVRRFAELQPGRNELFVTERPPGIAPEPVSRPRRSAGRRRSGSSAGSGSSELDRFADRRILVLIAAYRDPELANTVANALTQAAYPEHVRFAICHQFDDQTATMLDRWSDDPRFSIDALHYSESQGCCWARHRTFQRYDGEPYILQIDAHTLFAARWDVRFIEMLEATGAELPVITTYPPNYSITDTGDTVYDLDAGMQSLYIDQLRDDLTTVQKTAPVVDFSAPVPSPTVAAGQIFTRGRFCTDVPYDPNMYYAGEEISLAARAFTNGYELFCPTENLIWHLYDHDHPKHWEDHSDHHESHHTSVERLSTLFRGDPDALGPYGLGTARSLAEFERMAGVRLRGEAELPDGGLRIDIDRSVIEPRDDYVAFVVVLLDDEGAEVARRAIRAPDVLDLSRSSITLHDLVVDGAVDYLVVPTRRGGAIGEVALRRL